MHMQDSPDPRDTPDDVPPTPPDEPTPPPVQDPPAEPVEPPYIVEGRAGSVRFAGGASRRPQRRERDKL